MAADADRKVWELQEPYLHINCHLAEGPFYEAATHSLRFLDIRQKRIHTVDLAVGPASVQTLQLDTPPGVTADIEGVDPLDKIVAGLKYGLAVVDRKTGAYEYLGRYAACADPPAAADNDRLRSNDGGADPHGRFWLGAMTDFGRGEFQPEGGLYRFEAGGTPGKLVIPGLTIPNTIGFSPDGRTLYYTNTTENVVYAYDYDGADGSIANERIVFRNTGPGTLDGFRVDVNGNLWQAIFGGFCVVQFNPNDGGRILAEIRLPTRNVTCTQFVGTELYITTAYDPDSLGGPQSHALGGAIFRVDVGVEGTPLHKFKLSA